MTPWKILVVDDEEGIHGITRMIFRGYEFEQRPIELISAMNSAQAREQLQQHPDIALVLLDVVMETDDEGLQLVEYIRQQMANRDIRIILRTGHPGYAPEAEVIVNYDINDYLSKAELSASRLLTAVVVALRSYRDIKSARQADTAEESVPETAQSSALSANIGGQLNLQVEKLLKQSKRLQQFDLNPVAQDLVTDLHTQQQRLQNNLQLLHGLTESTSDTHQPLNSILDDVLRIFLPQSRREGWLVDYAITPELATLSCPALSMKQLLLSLVELALLHAQGEDIKLSLQPISGDQLSISTTLPYPAETAQQEWAALLQQRLQQLCHTLAGELLPQDADKLYCRISI